MLTVALCDKLAKNLDLNHSVIRPNDSVATNKLDGDLRSYVIKYLSIGEWVMDQGISYMSSSKYFERKR